MSRLIEMLVHGNGDALLRAVARGEGSAGIGAAGAFSAKFQGGVLHCHGKAGITFGLGAGATVDLQLGVLDGMAMLGVMALRGGTDLFKIAPSMSLASYMQPLSCRCRAVRRRKPNRQPLPARPLLRRLPSRRTGASVPLINCARTLQLVAA